MRQTLKRAVSVCTSLTPDCESCAELCLVKLGVSLGAAMTWLGRVLHPSVSPLCSPSASLMRLSLCHKEPNVKDLKNHQNIFKSLQEESLRVFQVHPDDAHGTSHKFATKSFSIYLTIFLALPEFMLWFFSSAIIKSSLETVIDLRVRAALSCSTFEDLYTQWCAQKGDM